MLPEEVEKRLKKTFDFECLICKGKLETVNFQSWFCPECELIIRIEPSCRILDKNGGVVVDGLSKFLKEKIKKYIKDEKDGEIMIPDWEKNIFVECPRCKKIIKLLMQELDNATEIFPTKQINIPTKKQINKYNNGTEGKGEKKAKLIEFE